ncbi:MAG: DNA-binding MarR family transcriptional regulator [Halieaceae bacterium]|jgi:DNA-binding MarR family transcriptional regulator
MKKNDAVPPQLMLENQLCFPLYSATNAVIRAYRPLLEVLGLTYLQYIVLMVFWQESSLNVKELGQRLRLDSGTLTPLLKRLESKGLVERKRSELDERVRIITITRQGMELQDRARHIPKELACAVALSQSQRGELKALCEQILVSLNE